MPPCLQDLIDQACAPEAPHEIRCLGRNHALDLVDLSSTHPDASTCGQQIQAGTLP